MNRLPPEAITLCATFVSSTDPRPIIPLTHVCRYWRNAIISSPRNWASIDNRWKQLIPTCLHRARVVPLTVNIKVSAIERDETFVEAIIPHTSRIDHLSLTGYQSIEAAANVFPTFFTSTMHDLISLELQQSSDPVELFHSRSVPPAFSIPWKLSRLTSLHLTRTPLYPAITSVTSLLDLRLDGYRTPFRFPEFIGFLGANPNLQSIVLDVQFEYPPSGSEKRVSLPRLRRLSLTCAVPLDAKMLISSISLPRGVSLEVAGSSTNSFTTLPSFLPSPPTQIREILAPIMTIKYQYDPGMIQFYGSDSDLSFRRSPCGFAPHPELSLFTVSTVRELHLKTSYDLDPSVLSQFPALETLALVDVVDFSTLFAFLTVEPVLCPSLKTIGLLDCRLGPRVIRELEEVVVGRRKSTAARLYRIVIVSQAGRFPVDHDLILQLRRSVPCVDVRIDDKLPDLS